MQAAGNQARKLRAAAQADAAMLAGAFGVRIDELPARIGGEGVCLAPAGRDHAVEMVLLHKRGPGRGAGIAGQDQHIVKGFADIHVQPPINENRLAGQTPHQIAACFEIIQQPQARRKTFRRDERAGIRRVTRQPLLRS